jgi:hypothetical protein
MELVMCEYRWKREDEYAPDGPMLLLVLAIGNKLSL